MNVSVDDVDLRDDAERSLGLARRGRARGADPADADREEFANAALYLGIIAFVAVAARLLIFVLGPAGELRRAYLAEHTGPIDAAYAAVMDATTWLGLPPSALLLAQIAMGVAAVVLVYALAHALLHQRTPALVAAAVAAVHPAGLVAANTFAPDALFAFFLLLGLCIAAARPRRDFAGSLIGGLALAAAALLRPAATFIGAAVAAWILVSDRRLRAVAAAGVLAVAALAPPTLWTMHGPGAAVQPRSLVRSISPPSAELPGGWGDMVWRVERTFASHAVGDLYGRLGLGALPTVAAAPLGDPAAMMSMLRDGSAATRIAVAWSGFNALLLIATLIGVALLAVRGQWSAAMLLGGLLLAAYIAPGDGARGWRLAAVGAQAVAAATLVVRMPRRERRPLLAWFRRKTQLAEAEEAQQIIPILTGRPL